MLRGLAENLNAKKDQMKKDFSRIADRYQKIFEDLNNELKNRIFAIDETIFKFRGKIDSSETRRLTDTGANLVVAFGTENGVVQAQITASSIKMRALSTIDKAKSYLVQQKKCDKTITSVIQNSEKEATSFFPVLFFETKEQTIERKVFTADFDYMKEMRDLILADFIEEKNNWINMSQHECEKIIPYLNEEIVKRYDSTDEHVKRVKNMIHKLADLTSIQAITC
jgi:hypothetical protein